MLRWRPSRGSSWAASGCSRPRTAAAGWLTPAPAPLASLLEEARQSVTRRSWRASRRGARAL